MRNAPVVFVVRMMDPRIASAGTWRSVLTQQSTSPDRLQRVRSERYHAADRRHGGIGPSIAAIPFRREWFDDRSSRLRRLACRDDIVARTGQEDSMSDQEEGFGFAPEHDAPIPYMTRIRDYYQALGYGAPYRWAHYAEVPFAPLKKPLAESRIGLITTAAPYQPDKGDQGPGAPITAAPNSTGSIPATPRATTICASRISATTAPIRRPRTATPGSRCRRCGGSRRRGGSARSRRAFTARRPTAATARPCTGTARSCCSGFAKTRSTRSFSSRFDRCVTRP